MLSGSRFGNAGEPERGAMIPPLPPKLRRKPEQSDHPSDGLAFEQDCAAWAAEKVERTRLLKERKGQLDKTRDRSKRKRDTDNTGVRICISIFIKIFLSEWSARKKSQWVKIWKRWRA